MLLQEKRGQTDWAARCWLVQQAVQYRFSLFRALGLGQLLQLQVLLVIYSNFQ